MSRIKVGMMCWVNGKCDIPENVGIVVEVMGCFGVFGGVPEWHIHSRQPMLCYHEEFPGVTKFSQCCGIPDKYLTPINSGEPVKEEETNHDFVIDFDRGQQ